MKKEILPAKVALTIWLIFLLVLSVAYISDAGESELPIDKVVHFILYGIASILFFKVFKEGVEMKRRIFLSILLSSLYGFILEVIQYFTPYRTFELADIAANILGATVFMVMNYFKR